MKTPFCCVVLYVDSTTLLSSSMRAYSELSRSEPNEVVDGRLRLLLKDPEVELAELVVDAV
jgi:hypothetical protein